MDQINLAGAAMGGLAAFFIGGFWYSKAAFGKIWLRLSGLTPEQLEAAPMGRMLVVTIPLSLISALVFAAFLGREPGIGFSTAAGIAAGLFWVAAAFGINYTFEQRPLGLFLVNGGYHTVQFAVYGFSIGLANTLMPLA